MKIGDTVVSKDNIVFEIEYIVNNTFISNNLVNRAYLKKELRVLSDSEKDSIKF